MTVSCLIPRRAGGGTLCPPGTAVQRISHKTVATVIEEHDPARRNSLSSIAAGGDEFVVEGQDQEERTLLLSVPPGDPPERVVQISHGIKLGPRRETPPPTCVGTGSDTSSLAPFQHHRQKRGSGNEGESTLKSTPTEDTPDACAAGMLSKAPPREGDATPEPISVPVSTPPVHPRSPDPVSTSTAFVPVSGIQGWVGVAAPPSFLSGPCFSPPSPFCEKSSQSVGYTQETNTPAAQSSVRARRSGMGADDSGEIMRIHRAGAGELDEEKRRHANGQPRTPTTDILRRLLYENTPTSASHPTDPVGKSETRDGEQGSDGMSSPRRRSRQGRRLFAEGSTVLRAFPTASENVAEVRRGPASLFSDSACR